MNACRYLIIVLCGLYHVAFGQEAKLTKEQEVIAMTILGEARGEGKAGMYAVACVISQRASAWHKTPMQVCLEPRQFSCWNTLKRNGRTVHGYGFTSTKLHGLLGTTQGTYAKRLAIHLNKLNRRWVGNADHYCTLSTNNYWTKGKKPIAVIGNHKFFKLR